MSISESEALASLRILVAIANADGTIHKDERRSLSAAIESLELTPERLGGKTLDAFLEEKVDLEDELRLLTSSEAREQIYRSAYFMAHADGACTPDEEALLDQIAAATNVSEADRNALERIFTGRASFSGDVMSLAPAAMDDPKARTSEVKARALKYAVLTAALGAFPIPGLAIATDLAVIAVQLKMVRDIGALWGHRVNKEAAKSLLYSVGLGTGARLAVNNLAKLIPGWGSVIGATTSFVSTYALATVIEKFFAEGNDANHPVDLRNQFKSAEAIAKSIYADHEDVIIASQRMAHDTLDHLTHQLQAGEITQEQFDARVSALA
jgi:uncharacterized protein (DUF697 family)/tellurite resistance protein